MRMSQGVEWSVHCLSVLAFLPEERALSAGRLAEFHGIPAPYLAKHLQALVRAGIIDSVPGPRGGFRLERAPADISLLDVVEALEGPEPAFRCTEIRQQGPSAIGKKCYTRPCGLAAAFANAENAWRTALRATTLQQLIEDLPRSVDPRQLKKQAAWLDDFLA